MFAVYDYLESLGCRWFFPGAYGQLVPSLKSIIIDSINRVERPDFRFLNTWYLGWMSVRNEDNANYTAWMDRTVGGIYSTGLRIWVNGMLVGHRPRQDTRSPFDIDVMAHIRPGELNCIALQVNTISADRSPRGGLYWRAFLWTPKG